MMFLLCILVGLGVGVLWRSFLPSYFSEKGKNVATREDIGRITEEMERVRSSHSADLKALEHQNAVLLEEIRGRHLLRLAAAEKRLLAHQEAFTLWRRLVFAHSEERHDVVYECQQWWERNCLYLSPEAREAFLDAYLAADFHNSFLDSHDEEKIQRNWAKVEAAAKAIVAGADLPSLGKREMENAIQGAQSAPSIDPSLAS